MDYATKGNKNEALKEDIKHILEDLWGVEKEDALHKIITMEARRGIQKVLCYSIEDFNDLSCVDEDGTVLRLTHQIMKPLLLQTAFASTS